MSLLEEFREELTGVCRYKKRCRFYKPNFYICNKEAGSYYGFGKKAGCYRLQAEAEKRRPSRLVSFLKIIAFPFILPFAIFAAWDDSTEEIP